MKWLAYAQSILKTPCGAKRIIYIEKGSVICFVFMAFAGKIQ